MLFRSTRSGNVEVRTFLHNEGELGNAVTLNQRALKARLEAFSRRKLESLVFLSTLSTKIFECEFSPSTNWVLKPN